MLAALCDDAYSAVLEHRAALERTIGELDPTMRADETEGVAGPGADGDPMDWLAGLQA